MPEKQKKQHKLPFFSLRGQSALLLALSVIVIAGVILLAYFQPFGKRSTSDTSPGASISDVERAEAGKVSGTVTAVQGKTISIETIDGTRVTARTARGTSIRSATYKIDPESKLPFADFTNIDLDDISEGQKMVVYFRDDPESTRKNVVDAIGIDVLP